MTIKTFPLQFTADKLDEIRKVSEEKGKSIKQFILDAIENELINKEGQ